MAKQDLLAAAMQKCSNWSESLLYACQIVPEEVAEMTAAAEDVCLIIVAPVSSAMQPGNAFPRAALPFQIHAEQEFAEQLQTEPADK